MFTKPDRRTLIWSDEFDGRAGSPPDPRWWEHETGGDGWGNNELQEYGSDPAHAFHDGRGSLVIRATRDVSSYRSARLVSRGRMEFHCGRIEARAKLPRGSGLWPAIWMLGTDIAEVGWPQCGEIDVMENVGSEPNRIFGTVHCPGHSGREGFSGEHRTDIPLHHDFHVFAADWLPDSIAWSIDGFEFFSVTRERLGSAWVFNHPFYILINLAVGGDLGGQIGPDTTFPADLTVDYVRVYAG